MPKAIKKLETKPKLERPKRVAAYARVSCGKDAMLHSLSAQVSFYSNLIQNHPGWQYAGVYSDEALTGTKESRAGFQKLLSECRAGNIDLIITKSISRFARNTVTLLKSVRELKALGVDVFFEEQNIHSLSSEGELMLTILASYAQEESLSASENQKWRIRHAFENGELVNWRFMFGYRISKGHVEIEPEEAEIVREIFQRVFDGESFGAISRDLNERGIAGTQGGKWTSVRISALLRNEKVTGNALLQKQFVNNHLEKKEVKNTGELPMFYAENTHPAIIDLDTFQRMQDLLKTMDAKRTGRKKPKQSVFTGKIVCGKCGENFKRVTSNKTPGWNCSTFQSKGAAICKAKKIPETTLLSETCAALGIKEMDEAAFSRFIDHIEVPEDNQLIFVFNDGRRVERVWEDRSRRESWTPEMKQAARERALKQGRSENGWGFRKKPKEENNAKSYDNTSNEE